MRRFDPRIAVAVLVLLGTCGFAAYRVGVSGSSAIKPGSAGASLTRDDPAPAFAGLGRWFNSEPLTLAELRGKVVLVDFWTYTCINCLRTLPELRSFYATYRASGLEIVGVHSPEFGFEKDASNVERAVREHEIGWPVALDNDLRTWQAFDNHYWPHVYLIDARGRIRFDYVGEGGGAHIEAAIRRLLHDVAKVVPSAAPTGADEPNDGITPEIYLGYERGSAFLGNRGGYVKDRVAPYRLDGEGEGAFFLGGQWKAGAEGILAAGERARIEVPFLAQNVFVVCGGASGGSTIDVLLDGKPIGVSASGSDVRSSSVTVTARDLYRLVRLPTVQQHRLTLEVRRPGASFYTFTFG